MMVLPLLPIFAATAAATASRADAASAAAAEAFREGCERGALRLTRARGRILKDSEMVDFAQVLDWGRAVASRTVVKFNYPPATFLIFAEYKDVQPRGVAKVCVLVSKVLTDRDASLALIETTPEIRPRQTWIPDMHIPEWIVDVPEQGYRKRMAVRDDGSTLLEVATYASAAQAPSSEARHP